MIVFHVFVSFILTVLKYLKCIDCWESLKTKPYEFYYRGWCWPGMGQSFLQTFFFIPLRNFGVRTWDFLLYILWYFPSELTAWARGPVGTKWDWRQRQPWGVFPWLNGASWWPNWKPSCNICERGGLCFDQRFTSILFLAHFIVLCGYTQESWILFPRQILKLRVKVTQWILRTWSNFVPGLQCALTAEPPPCSQVHGWYISVHITFHNQYTLSGSLIFILLSLY